MEIPIWAILGFAATLWVFSAKYGVIFLLGNPDFLQRRQINFAPISLSFRDLMRDRQTDRRQMRRPLQKALTLTVCEPNNANVTISNAP